MLRFWVGRSTSSRSLNFNGEYKCYDFGLEDQLLLDPSISMENTKCYDFGLEDQLLDPQFQWRIQNATTLGWKINFSIPQFQSTKQSIQIIVFFSTD